MGEIQVDQTMLRSKRILYTAPVVIGLVYLLLTITGGTMKHGMDMAARLTIVIPEILIWCIAIIGVVRLKQYAFAIRHSDDGKSLTTIANALLLMILYIILLAMRNAVTRPFIHTPYLQLVIELRNFVPIIVLLAATMLLFVGSRRLVKMVPSRIWSPARLAVFNLVCVLCFTLYVTIFYLVEPTAPAIGGIPRFVFPLHVLLITYVLPYLIIWAIGLLSCMYVAYYSSNVAGKIYRVLFYDLYMGLLIIFAGIFIAQLGVISRFAGIQRFNIGIVLVYALQALIGVGFFYIWRGSRSLDKIETS